MEDIFNMDNHFTNPWHDHLTAALEYARLWPVLPLAPVLEGGLCGCHRGLNCPDKAGKHPLISKGVYGASQDVTVIRRWWGRWPQANIGIQTGVQSGLLVLDVDPRNGGDESLAQLMKTYGRLPATPSCYTGGGGDHYYFMFPSVAYLHGIVPGCPGLEIKKTGGYVVAPPSGHGSGGSYRWKNDWRLPLSPVPAWLLALITAPEKAEKRGKARTSKAAADAIERPDLTQEDYAILNGLRAGKYGRIYQLLERGDWEEAGLYRKAGPYDTRSEADQALMNKLARITRDAGRTKALFLETELAMRDKAADREDYVDRTVRKAIAGLDWEPAQEHQHAQEDLNG